METTHSATAEDNTAVITKIKNAGSPVSDLGQVSEEHLVPSCNETHSDGTNVDAGSAKCGSPGTEVNGIKQSNEEEEEINEIEESSNEVEEPSNKVEESLNEVEELSNEVDDQSNEKEPPLTEKEEHSDEVEEQSDEVEEQSDEVEEHSNEEEKMNEAKNKQPSENEESTEKSLGFQQDPDSSFGSDIGNKASDVEANCANEETKILPHVLENDFTGFDDNETFEIKSLISGNDISKLIIEYENQLLTEALNSDHFMDYEEEECNSGVGIADISKKMDRRSSKRMSIDDTASITDLSDDNKGDDEEAMEVVTSGLNVQKNSKMSGRHSGTDSPVTGGKRSGKRSSTFNNLNQAFRKPFEFGWKRELVYRNASGSDSSKIQADVYYYTPKNKKIRSTREVSEHLSGTELTTENFTFFKEALGINDPDKEIIRSAAHRSLGGEGFVPIKKSPKVKEVKEVKPLKETKSPKEPKTPKDTKLPKEIKSIKETKTPKDKSPKVSKDNFKETLTVTGPKAVIGARKGAFPRIKVTAMTSAKSPAQKSVSSTKAMKKSSDDSDMEIGMLPPSWSPSTNKTSPTASSPNKSPAPTAAVEAETKPEVEAAPTPVTTPVKRKAETEEESSSVKRFKSDEIVVEERMFMQNFVCKVAEGYNALLQVFQYLKTQELLRAARVCRMWRDLAGHRSLWRTVRLKNSHVEDWQGLIDALTRHGTQHLDLRKIPLSNDIPENEQLWKVFGQGIAKVRTLTRIDLCRCPPYVIDDIAKGCPQLTTLNALSIKCNSINLSSLPNLKNLVELRLKSMTGTKLEKNLLPIKDLTNLKYLALTTFKDIGQAGCEHFKHLTNLEVLELGECLDLPENFGEDVLMKLTKLERLRLEKGQGKNCHTFRLLAAIKELPKLNQLELINFDVKIGFDAALAQCSNVKRLLLIPTYVTQSATTNYLILEGATKLKATLSHFVWGVTQELLRVTELFVDQCDSAGSKSSVKAASKKEAKLNESIPILKHGSLDRMENLENLSKEELKDGKSQAGQVEIQTLHKLQKQLIAALPNTKIKIVKIPFQATWKQTIADPPHH